MLFPHPSLQNVNLPSLAPAAPRPVAAESSASFPLPSSCSISSWQTGHTSPGTTSSLRIPAPSSPSPAPPLSPPASLPSKRPPPPPTPAEVRPVPRRRNSRGRGPGSRSVSPPSSPGMVFLFRPLPASSLLRPASPWRTMSTSESISAVCQASGFVGATFRTCVGSRGGGTAMGGCARPEREGGPTRGGGGGMQDAVAKWSAWLSDSAFRLCAAEKNIMLWGDRTRLAV